MADPYLMSLMHGEISPIGRARKEAARKNKFDIATEKYVDIHINSLNLDSEYAINKLVSPQMKKAQLKQELLAALNSSELDVHLTNGLKLLASDSSKYMSSEVFNTMMDEFSKMLALLDKLDPMTASPEELHNWSYISNEVMEGIEKMALAKYDEEDYSASLEIFSVLSVLEADNFDVWYRLGIAAHQNQDYVLSIKAYAEALKFNPDLIGARLFTIECYLKIGQLQVARDELEKVNSISKTENFEEKWTSFISNLEEIVKNS